MYGNISVLVTFNLASPEGYRRMQDSMSRVGLVWVESRRSDHPHDGVSVAGFIHGPKAQIRAYLEQVVGPDKTDELMGV